MAQITVSQLKKAFNKDRVILDGLSFQVDAGEHVAILGDNGAGKTTLLRLIAGELRPDAGVISIQRGKRLGYVQQINTFSSAATVEDVLRLAYRDVIAAENRMEEMHRHMQDFSAGEYDRLSRIFESGGGYGWQAELKRVANGLRIGPALRAQRFSSLSGGEQTRVCLARMILENNDILLLDEPTNHLDTASMEWLEDSLRRFKGTVLMVSHDRYFLDQAAQRIIEIEGGKAAFYSGNYSFYAQEKERRYQQQLLQYHREQAKVKQLEFQVARLKAWGSVYDNPALHKKAAAMEKRIERVQQTEKPTKKAAMHASFASEALRADRVLEVQGLAKAFGGRALFGPFDALIRGGGEKVALLGPNGAGKTTLLKILLGEIQPDQGTVRLGPSVRVAYLPQQVFFAHPERTLYDTLLYETGCTPQQARDRLGLFRFSGEDHFKQVFDLSGGEKARLKLCVIMMNKANLLILDEPTNHLDLSSREWIEEAVSHFEGTLLFVSHDRYFIQRFATHIWEIDGGFRDYPDCDWERYRRIKALEAQKAAPPAPEKKNTEKREKPENTEKAEKTVNQREKAKPGKDPRLLRRLSALEKEIAAQESALAAFDERMAAVATDYIRLNALAEEKQALEEKIAALYRQWEALAEDA